MNHPSNWVQLTEQSTTGNKKTDFPESQRGSKFLLLRWHLLGQLSRVSLQLAPLEGHQSKDCEAPRVV